MGSGATLVAAARLGRRYAGYDLDASYVELARQRVEAEGRPAPSVTATATATGSSAARLAADALGEAGFELVARRRRVRGTGVTVDLVATDADGVAWFFDVPGGFTSHRGGLARNDIVWRALGRAGAVRGRGPARRWCSSPPACPPRRSDGDTALRAAGPELVFDVIDLLADTDRARLAEYGRGGATDRPRPGFWTNADLSPRPHHPGSVALALRFPHP